MDPGNEHYDRLGQESKHRSLDEAEKGQADECPHDLQVVS